MQRGELTRCANRDRMPRRKIHCLFDHLVGAGEQRLAASLAIDKTGFLQATVKRGHEMCRTARWAAPEKPEHRHRRLLRARRERPRDRRSRRLMSDMGLLMPIPPFPRWSVSAR
jgi:hypothetical protein